MSSNGIYDLDKNLVTAGFLDGKGSLSVGITNHTNPIALHKIATNEPLGADAFIVDSVEATAGVQASGVTFLSGAGNVGFQASGDVYAELAVFPDPTTSDFTSALGPMADTKFGLPLDGGLSVVMLRWGADAKASGTGSIALGAGAGSIDFSAGVTGSLFFAVLQQVPRTTSTDDALGGVVKSWKLPIHVHSANDLAPRTHILSEVGGSGGAVRVFTKTATEQSRLATSRSSIRMEVQNMTLKDLDIGIKPFATQFLRRAFADNAAFDRWASTGGLLSNPANTLVSLDVILPGRFRLRG